MNDKEYEKLDEKQFKRNTKTFKDSERICIYCDLPRGSHAGFTCPKDMGLSEEDLQKCWG